MAERLNRRTFLMGAAGATGLASLTIHRRALAQDKVRLGVIGVGGRGAGNWSALTDQDVVMLCDVDLAMVGNAKKTFPKAEIVQDFRRVLDRKDIDAVVISTPDHWHAIPAVWAMETGKHVYCEKPLARTIHETRVMQEAARRYKRVTQMGNQIHAGDNYRRVVELVQSGAIGKIKRVDVWCSKRGDDGTRTTTHVAPPATLDYDLWVGPSAWRPYDPKVTPFHWRSWWEFGGGVLADMGCHYMDLAHWALDLGHPERVVAVGPATSGDNHIPAEMRVDYTHAKKGQRPAVPVTWWHGVQGPKNEAGQVENYGFASGVLFHGEDGKLVADYTRHKLLPEDKFADFRRPSQTIPNSVGHHQEWINAIKDGTPTTCNFDYTGALTEAVLLGNVAWRLGPGQPIEWDPKNLRIRNVRKEDWEPLLYADYRNPWKLERK